MLGLLRVLADRTENMQRKIGDDRSMLLIVLALVLLVTVAINKSKKQRATSIIVDSKGVPMQELQSDSRTAKFISSYELSQQGKELAGKKPFLIRNGTQRELVITQPDHLRDFYRDDTSAHPKPRNLNMGEYFGRILGDAVGAKDGHRWKIVRKHFDPEFSFQASQKAFPSLRAGVKQWCKSLSREAVSSTSSNGGFLYNVKKSCRFLPFKLMAAQLFGQVFDTEAHSALLELNTLHEVILHDVIQNTKLALKWSWPDFAASKRANEYNRKWEQFNLDLIARARADHLDCPAERIFRGTDEVREMTKTEYLHTMDEILFANINVSAAVLCTMLVKLASCPTNQASLRKEVRSQNLQHNDDLMSYVAGQNSMLHRVVMESMRFSPAFAFSLPECTAVAKNIGGYHIPASTAVVIDAGRLNTDSQTWGTSSDEFRPERFETISPLQCRYQLMRYGVGGNSGRCLGKHFADTIFKLAVVAVLEQYEIRPPDDEQSPDKQTEGMIRFIPIGIAK